MVGKKRDGDHQINCELNTLKKENQRNRAHSEKSKTFFIRLGLFGIIWWSVMIPALAGVAVGIWIDSVSKDTFPWPYVFLLIGLIIGCLNAWYWINQERQQI